MAYTIRNADGTVLLTLPDGQIDQVATSVTLIGRNYSSYGQYYNDNLVVMLQNFASDGVPPRSPLVGQLWYNKSDGRVYAYTLNSVFSPVGVATVSPSEPTAPNIGDLWIDSLNKQLYFTSDGLDFTLVGPFSTSTNTTTKNGWYAEGIINSGTLNTNTVAALYNNDTLLAIASSSTFSFLSSYGGMSSVQKGINLNTSLPGIRFVGTATTADSSDIASIANAVSTLTGVYLEVSPIGGFQTTNGQLNVNSDSGLVVGNTADATLGVDTGEIVLKASTDANLNLYVNKTGLGDLRAITVNPASTNPTMYLWYDQTISDRLVDIYSNVVVRGSLTVPDVLTTSLNVVNTGITVAYGQTSPSDSFAVGGGITLIGSTNHTLTWSNTRSSWESNTNFNLNNSAATYKINNQVVVTATSLGSVIASAPGLTSLGTLSYLTVTNISITSGTISTIAPVGAANLTLNPAGTGTVDVSYSKITSVSTGSNAYDAANIGYVDNKIAQYAARGYSLSFDTTGMTSPGTEITPWLERILPIIDPFDSSVNIPDGAWASVFCTRMNIQFSSGQYATINAPGTSQVTINGNSSADYFVISIPNEAVLSTSTQFVYTLPTKEVWQFQVSGGAWQDGTKIYP